MRRGQLNFTEEEAAAIDAERHAGYTGAPPPVGILAMLVGQDSCLSKISFRTNRYDVVDVVSLDAGLRKELESCKSWVRIPVDLSH